MKILGIVGLNKKKGNSYFLPKRMLQNSSDIERRIIEIAEFNVRLCELCLEVCSTNPFECVIRVLETRSCLRSKVVIVKNAWIHTLTEFLRFVYRGYAS